MREQKEESRSLLEVIIDDESADAELNKLVKANLVSKEVAGYLRGERKKSAKEYQTIVSSWRPQLKGTTKSQIEKELKEEGIEAVLKLLPQVIVNKLEDSVPKNFILKQIVLSGEVSGKPFGIGVGGSVQIILEKKS